MQVVGFVSLSTLMTGSRRLVYTGRYKAVRRIGYSRVPVFTVLLPYWMPL